MLVDVCGESDMVVEESWPTTLFEVLYQHPSHHMSKIYIVKL